MLASLLEQDHAGFKLQELGLSHVQLEVGGFTRVIEALEGGKGSDLQRLNLTACRLWQEDGHALGRALSSGSMRKLEHLKLYATYLR